MKAEAPLSILAVTLRYPPYVAGGYELLTRDAVEALRARGHRVQVLAGRGSRFENVRNVFPWLAPDLEQNGRDADLFELSFGGSNTDRFRLHFFRLANYRATKRALDEVGADVLLFFNLGLVSLAPLLAARHLGIPTVGYVADLWPTNHWLAAWRGAEAASAKVVRLDLLTRLWHGFRSLVGLGPVLACSAHLARALRADGLPGEDLEVLPLGVPPDVEAAAEGRAAAARGSGAPLRVACISSLWRGKGQHVLLEAVRRARSSGCDVEVVIAGASADATYRRELEALSQAAELEGAVTFAGALDRGRLSELLGSVHVLAMPSLWNEPFGLATLEGMAHGLAVLASDTGASPEIVADGETGLVLAAGDEEAWSEALQRLERDEGLRARLAANGRRHVRVAMSHARFVDGLEAALGRALGEGARVKILVVSQGFPPRGVFGTEFYTKALVDGLRGRGHEAVVLHPERSGSSPRYTLEEVDEGGQRIFLLHNPGDPKKRFEESYRDARVEARFEELLERLQPDVVHFTYLLWGLSVRLPRVARERGIPSVVTLTDYGLLCHRGQMVDWHLKRCFGPHPPEVCARCIREPAPYDHPPVRLALHRAAVRGLALVGGLGRVVTARDLELREREIRETFDAVRAFVAPTRVLAEAFGGAGISPAKITQLVYAFDEAPYRHVAGEAPPETPRFGFLGQFAPHKGLGTLLSAAEILDRRDPERPWELVLHGGGSGGRHRMYAPRMLAGRTGGRVRVGAPFGPDEAPRVLAGLSALVLPSEWDENAPLSILQARAVGVPVLASDVPGIAEVVDAPGVGRLVPLGDAAALAERMQDVLTGDVRRNPAPGLPLSLSDHLDKIEAVYERIRRRER